MILGRQFSYLSLSMCLDRHEVLRIIIKVTQSNTVRKCSFKLAYFMEHYPTIRSYALAGYLMTWKVEIKKDADLSNLGKLFDWELKDQEKGN